MKLRQMPTVCKSIVTTIDRKETNYITLAVRLMGDWLTWTFPHYYRTIEVYGGHYGLFYEIDWNGTLYDDSIEWHSKVCLEICYVQVAKMDYFIFILQNIMNISISMFNLLVPLILNNDKQFSNNSFIEFYANLGIRQQFMSVK